MSNTFVPIFGLLFISLFCFLAWNNFELPNILVGKTNETIGKIYEIHIQPGVKGVGYIQNISYSYSVDNNFYFNKKKIGNSFKWQQIGNNLSIEYEIDNPKNSNLIKSHNNFSSKIKKSFSMIKKNGYSDITITNGIFNLDNYADFGVLIESILGESFYRNDTLIIQPYSINKNFKSYPKIKYFVLKDTTGSKQLTDLRSGNIYNEIRL